MDKLGVKPNSKVTVLGIKDEIFWKQLQDRATDIATGRLRKGSDLIFFSAESQEDLNKLARLKNYLKSNGAIWVVSLKGKPQATRRASAWGKRARIKDVDVIAAAINAGLVDNKVVSFSETHTALKLVIPLARR